MKASELRIGNKFMNNGLIDTVTGVDRAGFVHFRTTNPYHDRRIHQSLVEGVPLTEEWLIKFGFEMQMFGFGSLTTGEYLLKHIGIHKIGGPHYQHEVSLHGRMHDIRIEYVHQLQNLYFALTGEELTVKETNG